MPSPTSPSPATQPRRSLHPALVYTAISIALLLPVLLWPLAFWHEASLNPAIDIGKTWLTAGATLLLIAVTADSMLSFKADMLSPMFTALWIFLGATGASLALRGEQGAYVLAVVFAMHALRSGGKLWRNEQNWWLWPAWARDTTAAFSIFIWIALIGHAG